MGCLVTPRRAKRAAKKSILGVENVGNPYGNRRFWGQDTAQENPIQMPDPALELRPEAVAVAVVVGGGGPWRARGNLQNPCGEVPGAEKQTTAELPWF